MTLKLTDLRLPVEAPEAELPAAIAARLGLPGDDLQRWKILRKSLDARRRDAAEFVYTAAVELPSIADEQRLAIRQNVDAFIPPAFDDPDPGTAPLEERPLVVGTGPAGLMAGYYLAQKGYRPILIDRGHPVKVRVPAIRRFDSGGELEGDNNYLFGEGGAGCFSDGKLTCRITGPDVDRTLEAFVDVGGRESIRYENRPHLGSNRLPMISRNFRRKIEAWGGEYRFGCRVDRLLIENGRVVGVETSDGPIRGGAVFLGIGHSARDTYERLLEQRVPMTAKAFQLGLRIEQPQEEVNRWKYGTGRGRSYVNLLGAADYSLVAKRGKSGKTRDLYTFCMCAGGMVIPSVSEPGQFCTNGMSNSRHDTPFANSGLMVTIEPHEFGGPTHNGGVHPLAGIELQRRYERAAFVLSGDYRCPVQSASRFLGGRGGRTDTSYPRGTVETNLNDVLPPPVAAALREGLPKLGQKWRGDGFLKEAVLHGPEMRGSSPVRIDRDRESRQTPGLPGLYPIGEGAGYAGGIVSAAVDGLRSARELVRTFAAG